MLQSISWQEFSFTLTALVSLYYVCIIAFFYQRELIQFLKGKRPHTSAHQTPPSSFTAPPSFIGAIRFSAEPAHPVQEETPTEELRLATQEPEEAMTVVDPIAEKQQQDLTEILGQIQSLAQVTIQTPTIELQTLFKTLLANYPDFVGTIHQPNISQSITETLAQHGHAITEDEVQSWWPT